EARESADQAALDAQAAREAAAAAEQAAKDARAAATRADAAATEAEQAAKDALKYAQEAQAAAERAERQGNAQQIETGTIMDADGAIGDMFYVIDHIEKLGEPEILKKTDACDNWIDKLAYTGGCTITAKIRFKAVLDLYLCSPEALDPAMCPASAATYLGQHTTDEQFQVVTHSITMAEYQQGIDPIDILFGGWIDCAQKLTPGGEDGSWGGCAWAALDVVSLFAGKALRPIADAVRAMDAAARTGIAFDDAYKALRALGLSDEVIAGIGSRALQELEKSCKDAPTSITRIALAAHAGGGYCPWLELGGPGSWMAATENMSQADRAYEQLVTGGVPSGISYKVPADTPSGFVKFDGYMNGTLIDAKNIHYKDSWINAEGKLKFPTAETRTIVKQVKAANGTPIVWYMSDEKTRAALELWAADNKVEGIKFVFRQGQS
ncbi:virulence factor, partial [Streptomyces sp. NPDC019396]